MDSSGSASEETRETRPEPGGTPQAGPPPARPGNGDRYARNQRLLLGIAAGILAVVLIAGSFVVGYLVGDSGREVVAPGIGRARGLAGGQAGPAAGLREQFGDLLRSGEGVALRGKVTSVSDSSLTVETASGSEQVELTGETRYLGRGIAASGQLGAASVKAGEQVLVVAKKTDGKLQALLVRVAAAPQTSAPQ